MGGATWCTRLPIAGACRFGPCCGPAETYGLGSRLNSTCIIRWWIWRSSRNARNKHGRRESKCCGCASRHERRRFGGFSTQRWDFAADSLYITQWRIADTTDPRNPSQARFGRVGRRGDRKGRCGPVSSRLPSACRSKTTLGDDVALARKRYRRPLHPATGRRVERFPAMHRDAIVPQQRIADLPVVAIDELRPGRELIDLIEQSRTGRIVHPLDTDRCRRVEVKRLSAGCRVAMHQRVKDGRRLALGFLRDHPVDALIASKPLGIAEDCAPALDRVLEAIG